MKNAFTFDPHYKMVIFQKTVMIVDDVATSYSTFSECAKVLKRNGAKSVWGVSFAREL